MYTIHRTQNLMMIVALSDHRQKPAISSKPASLQLFKYDRRSPMHMCSWLQAKLRYLTPESRLNVLVGDAVKFFSLNQFRSQIFE